MQNSTAYLFFALGQGLLSLYNFHLWRRRRETYLIFLILPMAAVVYDNLILALGSQLVTLDSFAFLSRLRFLGHALFTPAWIAGSVGLMVAALAMRRFGQRLFTAAIVLYGLMVIVGLINEVILFEGELVADGDVVYLTNVGRLFNPPPPSLVMLLVSLACGFVVLVRQRLPWMALGAMAVLAAQAGRTSDIAFVLVNSGEVLMAAGLALTAGLVERRLAITVRS